MVEAGDEARDAERPDTSGLRIFLHAGEHYRVSLFSGAGDNTEGSSYLLDASNVPGDVLDRDGVLDGQAVGLALHACAVDEDASVGSQAGKAEADVVVEHGRLADGSRVLELEDGFLLGGEDDAVLAADSDGAGTLADGFERIVDLEEVAVGAVSGRASSAGEVRGVVSSLHAVRARCRTATCTKMGRTQRW